jgi:hypothetical protein
MKKTIRDLISTLELEKSFQKVGFTNLKAGKNFEGSGTNSADCVNRVGCAPTNEQTNCGGGNLMLCVY